MNCNVCKSDNKTIWHGGWEYGLQGRKDLVSNYKFAMKYLSYLGLIICIGFHGYKMAKIILRLSGTNKNHKTHKYDLQDLKNGLQTKMFLHSGFFISTLAQAT